jgi:hypothetical protein
MKPSELLSSKKRWTTGCHARSKKGREVNLSSRSAVCWCIEGALRKCGHVPGSPEWAMLLHVVYTTFRRKVGPSAHSLHSFNDHSRTTFKDVQKALKKANL